MKNIAILLTCHNRKDKTLMCLSSLYTCIIPQGYSFEVFLVDDGSTDGTSEAVREQFPVVNLIQGDGNLYWNRGMYLAWKTATEFKDYDIYLWLNDDTLLFADAMRNILAVGKQTNFSAIICGATCAKGSQQVTYSGLVHSQNKLLAPNGTIQQCHIVNGNFLLVPKVIFDKVGNLDWKFTVCAYKKQGSSVILLPSLWEHVKQTPPCPNGV